MKNLIAISVIFSGLSTGTLVNGQSADEWNSPIAIPADSARVEIKQQIEISVDVPGTLVTLSPSERGGIVKKDQVVVEINREKPEAELAELELKAESTVLIEYAVNTLEVEELRLKDMQDRIANAGSKVFTDNEIREQQLAITKAKAELKKSKEDQKAAQLAVATKRVELKQYTRKAEFDGIVTELHKKAVGASVRQGDPVMTIVNFEEMLITLSILPRYEDRINVGDKVLVRRIRGTTSGIRQPSSTASPFKSSQTRSPGEALPTALPQSAADEHIFVGKVTFCNIKSKADEQFHLQIEAVVKNKLVGTAKYLLHEGSRVEAIILSP